MPAPARGRRAASRASPFQQVDVGEIRGGGVGERGEDEREAGGGLGGRARHNEEHEYLAGDAEPLRQRYEREVHGVEHQLDAHEDHDRVPAQQHAGDAQREQHGRSEEHTSELQSQSNLVCRLLLEKKKKETKYRAGALSTEKERVNNLSRTWC